MECFAVYADEIEARLDCFFYRPANRIKIKSKHPIKIIEDIISKIIHPPEYKRIYSQSGYQLLRAQNVRPYRINITTNQVFFDKEFISGNTLIFPEIGDVLVVRSGVNTGDCAVIDKNYKDVILGADNLVCKCKEEISPKYLMIYLSSDFGKKLLAKYITGATNSHITPQNLGKIQIPIPPLETQNKIVQLMDKAYSQKKEKESKAQQLLDSINDYVLSELGITQPPDEKKTCYSIYSDEIEGRFDPHFYRPEFRILEENLSKLNHKNLS